MGTVTFLFTDIEGSTRLWEQAPGRMGPALASHDALVLAAVTGNRGCVVKTTGDGAYAAFDDPLDAVRAAVQLQQKLGEAGIDLRVRCGIHAGDVERRDNDFFGSAVNRASRIMSAAHGEQILLSDTVAAEVGSRLPADITLRNLGRVRLRDLSSPQHLYQVVHSRLRQEFPALRSLETTPNNLPHQLASFVGRDQDVARSRATLATTRLLTLQGAGGLGKTRLALQIAADVMEQYPDGVWLIELAPLSDGALVAQAVASVLGVKEEAGRPVIDALLAFVKDRRMLLVVDNCEHIVSPCAEVVKLLLQAGPLVRILATSREALHIVGECIHHVPPLALPAKGMSRAELIGSDAVRLFLDRATAARPDFMVTDQNLHAAAEVCRRLDGIPLAIELAAARTRTLSVAAIGARLHDRFRLLTVGDATALPRQQTLLASIDWSYELLSNDERALLRCMAVFAGGWTLEAAETVGASVISNGRVLDGLSHLVDKSLVLLDLERDRYGMLETIRQHASERLEESGEAEQARARHLEYFVNLAEAAIQELVGPEQKTWLARFDMERENILVAHAWCNGGPQFVDLGLRLAGAVQMFWLSRGLGELGYRVTTEALAQPGAGAPSVARARTLFAAGQIGYFIGRYHEAQEYLEEAVSITRERGDVVSVAGSLVLLGHVRHARGDPVAAREHFEDALLLARASGNAAKLHAALNALAELHRGEGRLTDAEPLYAESLALQRKGGERANIVISLYNLAAVAIGRGEGHQARGMAREALDIALEVGSTYLGELVLDLCTAIAVDANDVDAAARFHGAAEVLLEAIGLRRDPADEAFLTPVIERGRAMLGDDAFAVGEAAGRVVGYEAAMSHAKRWLAG